MVRSVQLVSLVIYIVIQVGSYLFLSPCDLTCFRPVQLVVLVVASPLELCIYNAKYSCYIQYLATGFSRRMPYPLTWACLFLHILVTLSFDPGLTLCPFYTLGSFHSFLVPYTLGSFNSFLVPYTLGSFNSFLVPYTLGSYLFSCAMFTPCDKSGRDASTQMIASLHCMTTRIPRRDKINSHISSIISGKNNSSETL